MASPKSGKVEERLYIAMYQIKYFVQQQQEDHRDQFTQIIPQLIMANSSSPKKSTNLRPDPPTGANGLALDYARAEVAWIAHQRWERWKGNRGPRRKINRNKLPKKALKNLFLENAPAKLAMEQARFQELLDNSDQSCGLLVAGVVLGLRVLPLGTCGTTYTEGDNATIDPAVLVR